MIRRFRAWLRTYINARWIWVIGFPTVLGITLPEASSGLAFATLMILFLPLVLIQSYALVPLVKQREETGQSPAKLVAVIALLVIGLSTYILIRNRIERVLIVATNGWLLAFMVIAGLASSAPFRRPVFRVWDSLLAWAFGDTPGRRWIFGMWVALLWAITVELLAAATGRMWNIALPAAIACAFFHWRTRLEGRWPKIAAVLAGGIWALIVYRVPYQLRATYPLLATEFANEYLSLFDTIWPLITVTGILGLIIQRRIVLRDLWFVLLTAVLGGAVVALLLAYPLFSWSYRAFAPDVKYGSSSHNLAAIVSSIGSYLVALGIVPIAVWVLRPGGARRRFLYGFSMGCIVGAILFGTIGAPSAGLAVSAPLYDIVSRSGDHNLTEWQFALVSDADRIMIATDLAFWLAIVGTGILGGLSGLFTPISGVEKRKMAGEPHIWGILALIGTLPLLIVAFAALTTFVLIIELIAETYNTFGFGSPLNVYRHLQLILFQPWLALTLAQLLALRSFREPTLVQDKNRLAGIAFWSGFVGWIANLFWIFFSPSSFMSIYWLITLLLSTEMIATGWRLRKLSKSDRLGAFVPPKRSEWTAAGASAGLLVIIFAHQTVAKGLNLREIALEVFSASFNFNASPTDQAWLFETLEPLYRTHAILFSVEVIGAILIGGMIGLGLSFMSLGWIYRVWELFCAGITGILRRVVPGQSQRQFGWAIDMGVVAVGLVVTHSWFHSTLLAVILLTLFAIRQWMIRRLPLVALFILFVLCYLILLQHWTQVLPLNTTREHELLLLIPLGASVYHALHYYAPYAFENHLRIVLVLGLAVLAVWPDHFITSGQPKHQPTLSRLSSHQKWEVFDQANSLISSRLVYTMMEDHQETLWFAGNSGILLQFDRRTDDWTPFLPGDLAELRYSWVIPTRSDPKMFILEDTVGRIWIAWRQYVGVFDPMQADTDKTDFLLVGHVVPVQESSTPTRSEICNHELALEWDLSSRRISWSDYHAATRSTNQFQVYSCLETRTNITGITLDNAGDLWVSTAGQGVFHISGHQPISNAVWAHFDSRTSALASDYVHSIAVDQNNNLLALTDNGIERFDGVHWEQLEVTVLADPATIFVDSQNGTWVGSEMGACQLSGEQCIPIVTNVKVAAFAEAPDGTLWIGTHDGLLQYDLEDRRQTWFDTENSALPGNQVERLYRDSAHGLWIIAMAPWSNTGIPFPLRAFLGFCLFGYLFIHVRRGYKQLKTI